MLVTACNFTYNKVVKCMYRTQNAALLGVKNILKSSLQGGVFSETLRYAKHPFGKMVHSGLSCNYPLN